MASALPPQGVATEGGGAMTWFDRWTLLFAGALGGGVAVASLPPAGSRGWLSLVLSLGIGSAVVALVAKRKP